MDELATALPEACFCDHSQKPDVATGCAEGFLNTFSRGSTGGSGSSSSRAAGAVVVSVAE